MKTRKAFYASIATFGVTLFLLLFTSTIHGINPNNIDLFPGLRGLLNLLDKISGIDAFIGLLSGISSIVTGIVVRCRS
jgi:hypothetical protein